MENKSLNAVEPSIESDNRRFVPGNLYLRVSNSDGHARLRYKKDSRLRYAYSAVRAAIKTLITERIR